MTLLRVFLALIALACASPASAQLCAPVDAILSTLASAANEYGGGQIDILEGTEALDFLKSGADKVPKAEGDVYAVISIVAFRPDLPVVVTYISLESCVVGHGSLSFDAWNTVRVGAGLKHLQHPVAGVDA